MSLLVVGALHWDVVVQADRMPRLDETLAGQSVAYRFGGKGGNQAIAAARSGCKTAFAGRIGADDAGQAMRKELISAGIDVSRLQKGAGASGMSVAITVAGGEYGAVIVSGENREIGAGSITLPMDCRIVLMQNELAPQMLPAMARKASDAGAELWLNAAPADGLGPDDLRCVDVLIVNRIEAADLFGMVPGDRKPADLVAALRDIAPKARVVVTLGADGVAFSTASGVECAAAPKIVPVSMHGAGDVFVGTLAAASLRGESFAAAIATAQQAAAGHVAQIR
ncbi:PfkB family carbohydrate kinase [Sulfitobacter sp. D35]|uniref:PfkB family carbohydrate kinase n=1 Tax=Sulfitobacter sp. D35 TaxID=3083252 RepID=UPI00297000C4|nr:PfkB family carbohydrate kinase [Sulfitobacter sp. D35]MDW4500026.1 PfkB family carbohydrate kinase [Sulfitobacter sp. D35]